MHPLIDACKGSTMCVHTPQVSSAHTPLPPTLPAAPTFSLSPLTAEASVHTKPPLTAGASVHTKPPPTAEASEHSKAPSHCRGISALKAPQPCPCQTPTPKTVPALRGPPPHHRDPTPPKPCLPFPLTPLLVCQASGRPRLDPPCAAKDQTHTCARPDPPCEEAGGAATAGALWPGACGFRACAWELRRLARTVDCQCSSETGRAWLERSCAAGPASLRTSVTKALPSACAGCRQGTWVCRGGGLRAVTGSCALAFAAALLQQMCGL